MSKIVIPLPPAPFKLEVGSGSFPQSGYVHVDCNDGMPHLDIICKMGEETLPIPDESVSEILSNHSIEHVTWIRVGEVFRDWARVLVPGGRVFIRTPDLRFICEKYLAGETTREHPVDEGNMVSIFGDVGPSEWTNIKLYAGQNYLGNEHRMCFDMSMLTRVLERSGFHKISRLSILPVFSPGELQVEAFKK